MVLLLILVWCAVARAGGGDPKPCDPLIASVLPEAVHRSLKDSTNAVDTITFESAPPEFGCNGKSELTEDCVRSWLTAKGILNTRHWKVTEVFGAEGIHVKNIFFVTDPLFRHNGYVIKRVADFEECKEEVQGLARARAWVQSNHNRPKKPDIPAIALDEGAIRYQGEDQEECMILLQKAPGVSLGKMTKEHLKDPRINQILGSQIGRSLGAWHVQNLNNSKTFDDLQTMTHGDANHGNLILNTKLDPSARITGFSVTLIDNSTLAFRHPMNDVRQILRPWMQSLEDATRNRDRILEMLRDPSIPDVIKREQKLGLRSTVEEIQGLRNIMSAFTKTYVDEYKDTPWLPRIQKEIETFLHPNVK